MPLNVALCERVGNNFDNYLATGYNLNLADNLIDAADVAVERFFFQGSLFAGGQLDHNENILGGHRGFSLWVVQYGESESV